MAGEHDWRNCTDNDCQECQDLVYLGIIMGCDADDCDAVGYVDTDSFSWRIMPDGLVFCHYCFDKSGSEDIFGDK